ncbi:ATP-binding protein [Fictibacillus sp. Mic-4]|uniref:two-component system histidine kinase PnpS n=1 Tax=Fictibacillus TaxID=1329200 RepID=UPI0003FF7B00|nr:HAMP domain-containing sensor histidine kinase [Fictibacillus gelatini]
MYDLRNRVLSFFLIGIMLVSMLLAILVGNSMHHMVKEKREHFYEGELNLLALAAKSENTALLANQITKAEEDLKGSVVYLSPAGNVLVSSGRKKINVSEYPLYADEKLENSKVYKTKKAGNVFYTLPIKQSGDDRMQGYMQLIIPIHVAEAAEHSIWQTMSVGFLLCFVLVLIISIRVINRLVKPVTDAVLTAKELAKGNFKARAYEFKEKDIGELNHSLNVLARNLDQMTQSYESQQNRLTTLIENMGSGLILIDANGYVNLVNRAFKEIFQTEDWTGQLFEKVFPYQEIKELVEETFIVESNVRKQVVLPIRIVRKHFDVYSAPVLDSHEKLTGIVLVFHDITELKKLEQMRKDFVANVSHELKTPVTSLKGFAETLLDGAAENPEVRTEFLKIIWRESERLQELIQDLLELSKIEQNFSLNWEETDIVSIVNEVVVMLEPKAREKEIELNVVTEGDAIIEGDSSRLKQVFINLINNALVYTSKGGKVTVGLKEEKETVKFYVKDTGIGIKEEEIPRIFERFYRVDKARSRNSGGTGLGLAIVKHLIEAHHGRIDVKSKPGEGSTFTITFNKKRKS